MSSVRGSTCATLRVQGFGFPRRKFGSLHVDRWVAATSGSRKPGAFFPSISPHRDSPSHAAPVALASLAAVAAAGRLMKVGVLQVDFVEVGGPYCKLAIPQCARSDGHTSCARSDGHSEGAMSPRCLASFWGPELDMTSNYGKSNNPK